MKKTFLRVAALALAAISACALIGCKNKSAKFTSSWEVRVYKDVEGNADTQYVDFSVTRNGKKIKTIWMNVAKVSSDEAKIDFSSTSGGSKRQTAVSKSDVKSAKNDGGWIKIVDDWNFDLSTVRMSLTGNITINEIVFVSEEDKKLSASISKAYIYYVDKDGKIQGSQEPYTKSELEAITDSKTGMPSNLLDEQDKFDKA